MVLVIIADARAVEHSIVTRARRYSWATRLEDLQQALGDPSRRPDGVIVSARTAGPRPFTTVHHVRATWPRTQILLVVDRGTMWCINDAYVLGIDAAIEPLGWDQLRTFLKRSLVTSTSHLPSSVMDAIYGLSKLWHLTHRQTEILALATRGAKPSELPRQLAISPNTLRTHTRSILRKSGHRNLAEATRQVLMYANDTAPVNTSERNYPG